MQIDTPRLHLRRARPDDVDPLHDVMSSAQAMRYWSTPPHANREATAAWFPKEFPSHADQWIIEHQGRVIGYIGMWAPPEFGFILHPDAWGQGLGFEAAAAYLDHAVATHDIEAVTADVDPRNAASLKLLIKLGFVETHRAEKTFEINGVWVDSVYLALPRSSWRGGRASAP